MALYLYVKDNNYNRKNIIVISILLIGATQFKLSFILSGAILGFLILIKTFKNDKTNILILISLLLLILLPRIFYNFSQVTSFTFINIFTTSPMYFLEYLHNYKDNHYVYPINLFIPSSIGMVSAILGFHLLLLFFLKKLSYEFKLILIITFLSIIIHFIFGQQTSRLYFEFILWISVGFYFLEKKSFNIKYFNYALLPQLIFIFVASFYFLIMCIPTFFSLEKRDQFMKKNSFNYSAIKWVNNNIPNNATILSELRSISLYKNKTIPLDVSYISSFFASYDISEEHINYLKLNKPQFFITRSNNLENFYLKECVGDLYKASKEITIATRNPFNRNIKFDVYIYHFNYENLNFCVDLKQ